MTNSVRQLLDTFDRLTEDEQRTAAQVILNRILPLEYPRLDDEALARIAEDLFLQLDAQEAADREQRRQ